MSYTNTKVTWEQKEAVDAYGAISRKQPISIKARKQPKQALVKIADGRELLSNTVYYVDPLIESKALSIAEQDKLDGEIVMLRYIMCGLQNKPRMVKLVTV